VSFFLSASRRKNIEFSHVMKDLKEETERKRAESEMAGRGRKR